MRALSTGNPLSRSWWTFTLRGLLAIAFAVIGWTWPRLALTLLVTLFGAYALIDGLLAIVSAARAAARNERAWPLALEGVFGVGVGVAVLLSPVVSTAAVFVTVLLSAWALCTGVLELFASARLRRVIKGEWTLALSGLTRIALGVVLLVRRQAGLRALMWTIALYMAIYGVSLLALSVRLKRFRRVAAAGERPHGGVTPQPV
jgi:uncharacterized membrane protein HdeD (DUF308 family)